MQSLGDFSDTDILGVHDFVHLGLALRAVYVVGLMCN